jgi:alkane 1-monooxygenase
MKGNIMFDYIRYYIVTLMVLIGIAGFVLGGYGMYAGIATYVVLFVLAIFSGKDFKQRKKINPLIADIPLYLHIVLMFALFGAFAWRVGVGIGVPEGWPTVLAIIGGMAGLIWLSVAPNVPIAHELMHRRDGFSRGLAMLMCAFFADPNRDVPHLTVHHLDFDTPADGDTAYRGENAYAFMWRCTVHNYQMLWTNEKKRRAALGAPFFSMKNMIIWEILLTALIPLGAFFLGGWQAAALVFATQILGKFILEALNYLQHYGLIRVPGAPVEVQHTWNHLNWWDRVVGFEITNHIDHHRDGFMRFDELRPHPDAPQMPNIFLCAISAFIPPLWFKAIAMPRLKHWDLHFANPAERVVAREANRRAGWPDWVAEAK